METSQRSSEEYTTLNTKSRQRKQDSWGRTISTLCIGLIALLVVSIIYFIAARGLTTFFKDGVSFATFFTGTTWDPTSGAKYVGALPMIVTSFSVTLLAAVVATPFALAIALFTTELAPKRSRGLIQSMVELLVGIPSVVYGFIGLAVLVPVIRNLFGGTGSGILTATLVLFVMILPTITSLTIESLRSVPRDYRSASFALGATMWQTMHRVILRAALPGILTAVIFGMARAFGEGGGPSRTNGDWERRRDANEPDFTIGHSDFDFNGRDREHRHGDPTKRRPVVRGLGLTLNVVNLQPVGADD